MDILWQDQKTAEDNLERQVFPTFFQLLTSSTSHWLSDNSQRTFWEFLIRIFSFIVKENLLNKYGIILLHKIPRVKIKHIQAWRHITNWDAHKLSLQLRARKRSNVDSFGLTVMTTDIPWSVSDRRYSPETETATWQNWNSWGWNNSSGLNCCFGNSGRWWCRGVEITRVDWIAVLVLSTETVGGDDAEEGNCEQHLGNPDYHNPLLLGGDLINDDDYDKMMWWYSYDYIMM